MEFPLRVGCVDMGSNAIRFAAAEFPDERSMQVLIADRRAVRLGHGVYLSGRLDPTAIDQACEAMDDFAAHLKALKLNSFRAVATSAVRESRNGKELVRRIADQAGIKLEVIGGAEEARLVHLAVARRIPLAGSPWILVDLGGGSVEVSLVDAKAILWSETHTMGSVRLLEELTGAGSEPGRFRKLLEEYISVLKLPDLAEGQELGGYIATGGNIEALARLAGLPGEGEVSVLSMEALKLLIERLASMSYRRRVEELGLREDRADVLLPAALVYQRLGELVGASEIIVPHVGVKEGVMYDLMDELVRHADREDRLYREVTAEALALGRKYRFDEEHAEQVATLSLSLFDQCRSLHRLGKKDRLILHAAALLHDVGQFVSYRGHHKHSLYLILHSELAHFTKDELAMVANVARYHRKAPPREEHPEYMALSEKDRGRVLRLAALLRLADSLDREHARRVEALNCEISPDSVLLQLNGRGNLLLEGWGLRKKAELFRSLFGRDVRVRFLGGTSS